MYVSRVSKNLYVFSDVLYINDKFLVRQRIVYFHLFESRVHSLLAYMLHSLASQLPACPVLSWPACPVM
jgi:hypothetical protein